MNFFPKKGTIKKTNTTSQKPGWKIKIPINKGAKNELKVRRPIPISTKNTEILLSKFTT